MAHLLSFIDTRPHLTPLSRLNPFAADQEA